MGFLLRTSGRYESVQEVHKEPKTHLHSESAELTINTQWQIQNEERKYDLKNNKKPNITASIYFQGTTVEKAIGRL